jgi:hypothetical protein
MSNDTSFLATVIGQDGNSVGHWIYDHSLRMMNKGPVWESED